jgi:DNA-binding MarR family transcriptional regulator
MILQCYFAGESLSGSHVDRRAPALTVQYRGFIAWYKFFTQRYKDFTEVSTLLEQGRGRSSTPVKRARNGNQALAAGQDKPFSVTPLLGALLRVTHEALTRGILDTLRGQGVEMTATEFSVMRYPGPDGVRPIDLARRCNMTKQAMNYVLAGFEAKGYIERKSPAGQRSTAVHLTPKGWKLLSATRHCATEIEARWAAHVGARRFDALRASLHEIAVWLGKLPATPPAIGPHGKSKVDVLPSRRSGGTSASVSHARADRRSRR